MGGCLHVFPGTGTCGVWMVDNCTALSYRVYVYVLIIITIGKQPPLLCAIGYRDSASLLPFD